MCDEKEGAENGERCVDSGDQGMFDRCAPMMKSMLGRSRRQNPREPPSPLARPEPR